MDDRKHQGGRGHLSAEARGRTLAAAGDLTVFFPESTVHAAIRAAAEEWDSR